MRDIPHLYFDNTLSFRRDPYNYIERTCKRLKSDLFKTRLMLKTTVCMKGKEAAKLFYDEGRFQRKGAAPKWLQTSLFGERSVQTLDGAAHRARKEMFMSVMTDRNISDLVTITEKIWSAYLSKWSNQESVVLYDEMLEILGLAVCSWAGVPVEQDEIENKTLRLALLFDKAASFPFGYFHSRNARKEVEKWIIGLVSNIRSGRLIIPNESAAYQIAMHRDHRGHPLNKRVAAVEILNVLRPTMAVAVYIVFAAHALHYHPECAERLRREPDYPELFAQEVRRLYPFFPAIMAKIRHDFQWQGYRFKAGWKVVLDLYATNHDENLWNEPYEFRPERFRAWNESLFSFVPQGGGESERGHRCPGERITLELLKLALNFLVNRITYTLPKQDLAIDYSRLPALPRSFILTDVREAVPEEKEEMGLTFRPPSPLPLQPLP